MDKMEFKESMERRGMKVFDNRAYGIAEGYPIIALLVRSNAAQVVLNIRPDQWRANKRELRRALRQWGSVAWTGDRVTVTGKLGQTADVYQELIEPVVKVFKDFNISVDDTCYICHRGRCDVAAPLGYAYRPAHRACLESALAGARAKAQEDEANGSYVSGIAGAILGGIVGTIPSFLTIVWMERLYAVLFALIPLCAYYGYKLFRGRMNKAALICSVAMSVMGVYILNFALLGYFFIVEYNMSFGEMLQVMPAFLGDLAIWLEFTRSSVTEFIFAAIGVLIVWSAISRTSAGMVANAENVMAGIMPFGIGAYYPEDYSGSPEDYSGESGDR